MAALTEGMNWAAVGLGTVLAFLLGWLWYSAKLFGTKWAAGSGVDLGAASSMPMAAMGFQLLGTFMLAWVVGLTETRQALLECILIVLTIMVIVIANGLFAKKSNYAIATEAGFIFAMGVVMVLAQAVL